MYRGFNETQTYRDQHCGISSRPLLLLHLSKGDGDIRRLLWLKKPQNMEEKDKTKTKPLRETPVDCDPDPQLALGRSQVGRGSKDQLRA